MPETHGVWSRRAPGDAPQGKTKDREWVLPTFLVRWSQWSLLRCLVDQNRLSRMGPIISCLARSLMWHATVSVLPYWYDSSRSTWTLWWMWYWIWREVNCRKIFKIVRWAGMRQEKRPKVIIRAEKVVYWGWSLWWAPWRGCQFTRQEQISVLPSWYGSRRRTWTRCWMW